MRDRYVLHANHQGMSFRCKAIVKSQWGNPKQCFFEAVLDGYCGQHHPTKRIETLKRRIIAATKAREAAEKELKQLTKNETRT